MFESNFSGCALCLKLVLMAQIQELVIKLKMSQKSKNMKFKFSLCSEICIISC
jgi:hypothetical protein